MVPAHQVLHSFGLLLECRAAVRGQISREVPVEDCQVGCVLLLNTILQHPNPVLCYRGQHEEQ